MHIHYVAQVGSSAPAQGLCRASKVICTCTGVSEGLWWLVGEEDPSLILSFDGHVTSEDTRVLVALANSLFHSLTADVCPWSSKFVTMRCSLPWNTGCYSTTVQRLSSIHSFSLEEGCCCA